MSDEPAEILLIDDDEQLADILAVYLAGFNYRLRSALTPSAALAQLLRQPPALILLDVMLPERDGFSVCRDIAGRPDLYGSVPIIMLTARGEVIDRVVGLELGAADYLAKPFDPRELLARIRAVLRRQPTVAAVNAPEPPKPDNGLRRRDESRRAWLDGQPLDLTGLEYDLLVLFMDHPGRVFSRDEIMDHLRGIDADIFSRAVDALVSRLRQKLGDDSRQPRFIRTIWGKGYAFADRGEPNA